LERERFGKITLKLILREQGFEVTKVQAHGRSYMFCTELAHIISV
jgi:hypothetical protein